MALSDILMERVSRRGRTAQVVCRELGTVSVEALPAGELTALLRGADGNRAVVYAACRELQTIGEALRRRGQLFQPDEIMRFLSEAEVQTAFQAILDLSGPELQQSLFQPDEEMSGSTAAGQGDFPVSQSSAPGLSAEAAVLLPEQRQQAAVSAIKPAPTLTEARSYDAFPQSHPLAEHSASHTGSAALDAAEYTEEGRNRVLSPQAISSPGAPLDEEALTERVARRILAGLRQAAAVR